MMRRWKSGGHGQWRCGGRLGPRTSAIWAGSIRRRSHRFVPKRGRWFAMRRNCTIRCFRSARCQRATACDWREYFDELAHEGRVVRREVSGGPVLWIAVEQWPAVNAAVSLSDTTPPATLPEVAAARSDGG